MTVTATPDEVVTSTDLPVTSFLDAARHLRRPFTAAAVKFKVQAVWPKDDPTGGLVVAYIDARLAVERLNLVVPHLWHDAYRPIGNSQMWCDLTVDGITRSDVGEGTGKGLVSDALKRAAVKFGIGVSLYAIPKMILNAGDGTLKPKQTRDGKTLELTPKGETALRAMYARWLDDHGRQAFGDPLDHGDVEDHQGDPADVPAGVDPHTGEVTSTSAAAEPEPDVMTQAVFATFNEAYVASQCKNEVLLAKMDELGVAPPAAASATPADQLTDRVGKMTGSQARALTTWLQESTP